MKRSEFSMHISVRFYFIMEIGNVNDSKSYVMVKAMSKNYKNKKQNITNRNFGEYL